MLNCIFFAENDAAHITLFAKPFSKEEIDESFSTSFYLAE